MVKRLALVAICLASLSGNAMAQDAKTVIANAQKALGDAKSITYSGSAKDVAFQQCGANAADMTCRGTHDPMRPINNYVRVIDLAAPASRHTGATNNPAGGGATTPIAGTFFQQVTPQQADVSQPWGHAARVLPHAVGLPERRGREQRDRDPPQGRRQAIHRPELEPHGQGALRQGLCHQRLRERQQPRRAGRDVAGRKHHGRHAHRRHLHGLERFRRRDGAREDRADARRLPLL